MAPRAAVRLSGCGCLALVLLGACASRPPLPYAERPLLLALPLNFDRHSSGLLSPGIDAVQAALTAHLEDEGFRCESLAFATVVERWPAAVVEAGGLVGESGSPEPERIARARGTLVRGLVAERGGEAPVGVIVPTLLLREAPFNSKGTRAHWDGIYRKPRLGPGFQMRARQLLFTGAISGTSVWTSLYSPAGELLASGYGGIELAVLMAWRDDDGHISSRQTTWYGWVDRDDLFQDADKIEKGVELALEPVLAHAALRE